MHNHTFKIMFLLSCFFLLQITIDDAYQVALASAQGSMPNVPSNLRILGVTQSSITIGWNDNSNNEQGFNIYKWDGAEFTYFASVAANITAFTHSGLNCETSDFYKVSAYNGAGESDQIGWIEGRTTSCATLPNSPSNLRIAGATQSSITIGWNDSSNNEQGFNIYKWNGASFIYFASVAANVTIFVHIGLHCETSAFYKVSAYNDVGESGQAGWIEGRTTSCASTPGVPSNLRIVGAAQSSITIGWDDNSNNEQGFNIYKWNGVDFVRFTSVGANVTSFVHTNLNCEISQFYKVSAYNGVGESNQIGWIEGRTTPCANRPPNMPSNLRVLGVTQSSITIGWDDNSNNEQGFNVYKWDGSEFTYFATIGANVTTFTHRSLNCEISGFYKVSAYNGVGESSQIGWIEGRTSSCSVIPPAPTNVQASDGVYLDEVRVTWRESPGATSYEVWRHSGNDPAAATQIASTLGVISFSDASAAAGITYYYWVKAKNSSGVSEFSSPDSGYRLGQSTPGNPRWKILVLIYRSTDFSYTDSLGNRRRVVATMSQEEINLAVDTAARFFERDVPALTSGNMYPVLTVRQPERDLTELDPFDGDYWPSRANTAPDLDPTFDSVVVVWDCSGTDINTGMPINLQRYGGLTSSNGTRQTYATIQVDMVKATRRNVFKHEWGHSILYYFEAARISPRPTIDNHRPEIYVNCSTGNPYNLREETDDSPIPNSVFNNDSGFTHDYYSGATATFDQPARCLGIVPTAWASGGPVTKP